MSPSVRGYRGHSQRLDSWGMDHKESHTDKRHLCVFVRLCVYECLSSVVKRNQTVLSYAHTVVSENTAAHLPDDMHAHTHPTPATATTVTM